MEVPANVDEVAMINNIKEETENYNNTHRNASMTTSSLSPSQQQQENNESLVSDMSALCGQIGKVALLY